MRGREPWENRPSRFPTGRWSSGARQRLPAAGSAPPDADPAAEVTALAGLLAEVVRLAGDSALFPSRWAQVAQLALEPERAALRADPLPLSTEHIITQLNQLYDLIGDGHAQR
ncbi:MAG: hypothetical protein M3460_24215 [Actinomycetota bacterium]|nr:hypothetical protein [Actinomycetota bacterium]